MSDVNPFYDLTEVGQSRRFRTYCKVLVNGKDVTNQLDPYLVSVLVKDGPTWEATIELDDRDARLDIPAFDSPLEVYLGWTSESSYRVFKGSIADIEHGFGRKLGGRRMFIHGSGWHQSSLAKTPFQDHVGEGAGPGKMEGTQVPFPQASQQFAKLAGLTSDVGASFSGTARDYWSMNNESPMQWHSRLADDLGAFMRIEDKTIVFKSLSDFNKPNIKAVWGNNLISWRVRPFAARSMWSGASQQYYDHMLGQWTEMASQFGFKAPFGGWNNAIHKLPVPAPNANIAQQITAGAKEKANMYSGEGRIMVNGEPQASWGGTVTLIGARPGVDGTYYIMTADHTWSRQGYTTTMEVIPNIANSTLTDSYGNVAYVTGTVRNQDGSTTVTYSNGKTTTIPAV